MVQRRKLLVGSSALFLSAIGCKSSQSGEPSGGPQAKPLGDIVVGHYAAMTGSIAHFGQDTDKAIRLAIDEVNQSGGVKGRKIKLVTLDDRGDAAEAANAVSRLIDVEKAVALLGEVASSLSLAGGRIAQRRKIPMVSPSSTNPKVTEVGDQIFRVCFLDPFQGSVMAKFAREKLKMSKVAIIKDVRNDYSIGLADAFKKSFVSQGGSIVVEQSYSAGDSDFSAQVTAVRAAAPEAMFVPGYYAEVGAIAKTAQRLGLKIPLMGGDGWDAPDLYKIGGDALDGSYFSNHFAPDVATPKAKKFVADFTKKYGEPPTGLGALGYDAAMVLVQAMNGAKDITSPLIRDELTKVRDFEGVTGNITIDEGRNAKKSAVVLKISGGAAKFEAMIAP
ncbi:MAG: ABC transporter substrate-binding protein [Polyangiaceae bacterium]|nr:ABC transporter substrate-binding protein [Polyangiaceae bacterium]